MVHRFCLHARNTRTHTQTHIRKRHTYPHTHTKGAYHFWGVDYPFRLIRVNTGYIAYKLLKYHRPSLNKCPIANSFLVSRFSYVKTLTRRCFHGSLPMRNANFLLTYWKGCSISSLTFTTSHVEMDRTCLSLQLIELKLLKCVGLCTYCDINSRLQINLNYLA